MASDRMGFIHWVDRGGGPFSSTRSISAMRTIMAGGPDDLILT